MNDKLPRELKLLDPTAPSSMPGTDISVRLSGVEGKNIGMLDNGKPNFDILLSTLEELLLDRYPSASVTRHRKPTVAAPAPEEIRAELLGCDSVITGLGD
jgi:hypothetical protein